MDVLTVSLERFHEEVECSSLTNPTKLLEEKSLVVESGSEVYRPQSFAIGKPSCREVKTKFEKPNNMKIRFRNSRKDKERKKSLVDLLPPFFIVLKFMKVEEVKDLKAKQKVRCKNSSSMN